MYALGAEGGGGDVVVAPARQQRLGQVGDEQLDDVPVVLVTVLGDAARRVDEEDDVSGARCGTGAQQSNRSLIPSKLPAHTLNSMVWSGTCTLKRTSTCRGRDSHVFVLFF